MYLDIFGGLWRFIWQFSRIYLAVYGDISSLRHAMWSDYRQAGTLSNICVDFIDFCLSVCVCVWGGSGGIIGAVNIWNSGHLFLRVSSIRQNLGGSPDKNMSNCWKPSHRRGFYSLYNAHFYLLFSHLSFPQLLYICFAFIFSVYIFQTFEHISQWYFRSTFAMKFWTHFHFLHLPMVIIILSLTYFIYHILVRSILASSHGLHR